MHLLNELISFVLGFGLPRRVPPHFCSDGNPCGIPILRQWGAPRLARPTQVEMSADANLTRILILGEKPRRHDIIFRRGALRGIVHRGGILSGRENMSS